MSAKGPAEGDLSRVLIKMKMRMAWKVSREVVRVFMEGTPNAHIQSHEKAHRLKFLFLT